MPQIQNYRSGQFSVADIADLAGRTRSFDSIQFQNLPTSNISQVQGGFVWKPLGYSGVANCGVVPLSYSPSDPWNPISGNLCSGRVTSIATDPSNPNTLYLGSASGGVWKSTDGGSSWTPLTDSLYPLAVGSIAVDLNGVVYVGTGEGNNNVDGHFGEGILKSSDGGITWVRKGVDTFSGLAFTKIIVNPQNRNVLMAATNYASYGGTTTNMLAQNANGNVPGVYVSRDSGNTWASALLTNQTLCGQQLCEASDVIIDPNNASVVYAAVAGGIYASQDEGMTWSGPLGGFGFSSSASMQVAFPGRINLAISGTTLYAAADIVGSQSSEGDLFESADDGNTWTQLNTPSTTVFPSVCVNAAGTITDQCSYDLYVEVDPKNSNIIYLGGLDFWRTTDGGGNWTDLGGYVGYIHPDQHAFAFSPTSHDMIYVGNDGGIWSSTNASTCDPPNCWTNLNSGLAITQVTSVATHPTDPTLLLAGSQDNAVFELSGSGDWNMLDGGDSGWVAFDPSTPQTLYHTYSGASFASSGSAGAFDSWTSASQGTFDDDPSEFYVPLAVDPTSQGVLYLGTYQLYKTTDYGATWNLPNPGLSQLQKPTTDDCDTGECITALAVAPSNGAYVYAGTNDGKILVSTDGATTFTDVSPTVNGVNASSSVTAIGVNPTNPQIVYITLLPGFVGPRILESDNGGGSWSDISSNLPQLPATAVLVRKGGLFVGLDNGVYESTDRGASWVRVGEGLPQVDVRSLATTANGDLVAATYGRGLWILESGAGSETSESFALNQPGDPTSPFAVNGMIDDYSISPLLMKRSITATRTDLPASLGSESDILVEVGRASK